MTCQLGHLEGSQQRLYVTPQTTGAYVDPGAGPPTDTVGGAVRCVSSDVGVKVIRSERGDAQSGRTEYQRYTSAFENPLSILTNVIPATALTSRPEVHNLLRAFFPLATFSSGVSMTYSMGASARLCVPLSVLRLFNGDDPIVAEALRFAIMEQFDLDWSGGEKPTYTFTGEAAEHIYTPTATIAAGAASATQTVGANEADNYDGGGRVQIAAQNNAGLGFQVLATSAGTALQLGSATALTTIGDRVIPFAPTPVLSSQAVIGNTTGSFLLRGFAVPIKGLKLSIKNNNVLVKDAMPEPGRITDAQVGKRKITGTLTFRQRSDLLAAYGAGRIKKFVTAPLVLTMGVGAGRIVTLSIPQLELDVEKLNTPQQGPGDITLPFIALDSAEGANNACSLVYT